MSKIKSYALGTLLLVIAAPIYLQVKHRMAEPAGATCSSATKCRGNSMFTSGMCLDDGAASYCTHECSAADDCGGGLSCEAVDGTWIEERRPGIHPKQHRRTQGPKNRCVPQG